MRKSFRNIVVIDKCALADEQISLVLERKFTECIQEHWLAPADGDRVVVVKAGRLTRIQMSLRSFAKPVAQNCQSPTFHWLPMNPGKLVFVLRTDFVAA